MTATIRRNGRQAISLAAVPSVAVALLADLEAVTHLLGDLIDQEASRSAAPQRWAIPTISIGPVRLTTVLAPSVTVAEGRVRIEAPATSDSSADIQLTLDMTLVPVTGATLGTELSTAWTLRIVLPVPRVLLIGSGPAIDRTIAKVVGSIHDAVAAAL